MKKSNYLFATIVIIAFSILFNSPKLFSKELIDTTNKARPGFIFKLGVGGGSEHLGVSIDLGLNHGCYETNLYYRGCGEFTLLGNSSPEEIFNILGISYSLTHKYKILYATTGIGCGVLWGSFHEKYLGSSGFLFGTHYYQNESVTSLCIPLMLEGGFKFGVVTLTGKYEYMLNTYKTFYHGTINVGLVF